MMNPFDIFGNRTRGLARAYLMDKLPSAAAFKFEQEYFVNNDISNALIAAESELIDDYITEQLPADDRQCFEKGYLKSDSRRARLNARRRRIELIREEGFDPESYPASVFSVEKLARDQIGPRSLLRKTSGLPLSLWICGLSITLVGFLIIGVLRIHPSDVSAVPISLTLVPLDRGLEGKQNTLHVPQGTDHVYLFVDVPGPQGTVYSATIRAGGEAKPVMLRPATAEAGPHGTKRIRLVVSSSVLDVDAYTLEIRRYGDQSHSFSEGYSFSVVRP